MIKINTTRTITEEKQLDIEFPIEITLDSTINLNGKTLKCTNSYVEDDCRGCYFANGKVCDVHHLLSCSHKNRKDGADIIFCQI